MKGRQGGRQKRNRTVDTNKQRGEKERGQTEREEQFKDECYSPPCYRQDQKIDLPTCATQG